MPGEQHAAGTTCAHVAGAVVAVTGLTVLAGWALDVQALTSVLPGHVSMKANTALGLALCGGSLWLVARPSGGLRTRAAVLGAASLVVVVAAVTLAEYLLDVDVGIDTLLFADPRGAVGTPEPGRMSPLTAIALAAAGGSLLLHAGGAESRRAANAASMLAAVVLVVGMLGSTMYLYGATSPMGLGRPATLIAVHTSAALLVLGCGLLAVRTQLGIAAPLTGDGLGAVILRRLLPAIVIGPVALGWLRIMGEEAGLFSTRLGIVLMVLSVIALLTAVTAYLAVQMTEIEARRLEEARAGERLARAHALKSRFVSVASHELRTPLTAIAGFAQVLSERWEQHDERDLRQFAGIIDVQARRLARLVDELLTASMIESGTLVVQPRSVDVAAVVGEVARGLHVPDLRVSCQADVRAMVDPDHLASVLTNLLSNALKYGRPEFSVRVRTSIASVEITVCDEGDGVPAELRPLLFQNLLQERHDLLRDRPRAQLLGHGLGLSIVAELARANGGEASFQPNVPTGACFVVRLPAAPAMAGDAVATAGSNTDAALLGRAGTA